MKIFWPEMRHVPSPAGTALVANAPTYQAQLAERLAEYRATIDATGLPLPSRALTDIVDPDSAV